MNFKKFVSLLFVMFFVTAVVFAANNTRNVYSVYSDNFNGAHMYGVNDSVPSSDTDGIKFYPWDTSGWDPNPHIIMSATTIDGTASDPAPEGKQYVRYLWGSVEQSYSTTYVGCSYTRVSGVSTTSSINMSNYAGGQIKFSARSNKEYAKKCKVGFQYSSGTQKWFDTTLTNINENWQEFSFDLPGSIGDVSILFMIMIDGEPEHTVGEAFLDIDNIRWVKSGGAANLSVVRKKVSDNTEVSEQTISFSSTTFAKGWSIADQYLELDVDGEFSSNNWRINFYSSATEDEKAGLYNATINDKLPMAWRISCGALPYDYTDSEGPNRNSLEIGENKNEAGDILGLYDAGKVSIKGDGAKWWYPWFYVQKSGVKDDNTLALNNDGCHTFENDNIAYFDNNNTAAVASYERNPKVYIACDTKNAKSVVYEASLIINLSYE